MHTNTIETTTRCVRVRVAEPLYRRAGHVAVDRGISVSELIRQAIRQLVQQSEAEKATT